jgi:O-antigen/teichoic acid export membrane protein
MLNSAISAFFGLLFWIVAARTMPAKEIGLATAAISAAGLIIGLSKVGLDAGLIRYLPESKNKNGLYTCPFFHS